MFFTKKTNFVLEKYLVKNSIKIANNNVTGLF